MVVSDTAATAPAPSPWQARKGGGGGGGARLAVLASRTAGGQRAFDGTRGDGGGRLVAARRTARGRFALEIASSLCDVRDGLLDGIGARALEKAALMIEHAADPILQTSR